MKISNDQSVSATLIAHSGACIISRQDLSTIPTPKATASHTPIPHAKLMDVIEETLNQHQLRIIKEQYSVMSQGGMKLFGTLKLEGKSGIGINGESSDYRMALGVRASNDKTIPVQMIAGANIFVCDNLAFSGEVICMDRRHTSRIDIKEEVATGVRRAIDGFVGVGGMIEEWKHQGTSNEQGKALIVDAAMADVMPLHLVPDVVREWMEPKHEEFRERTVWSLHNAFTESFKKLKGHIAMVAATELARFLQGKDGR